MHDVHYAIRTLRRSPGFTVVAVVTLALGIGATTAIYSVVDTILLQPLPFAGGNRLVRVVENVPGPGGRVRQRGMTYPDFLEWRARTATLSDAVAVSGLARIVLTRDGTARVWGGMVSADTFALLGTRAMLGRTLDAGDAANADVAVLGFDTWRRVFHSDAGVVGTTMELRSDWNGSYTPEQERRLLTIVGVLPAAFEFPTGPMDFYTPFVPDDLTTRSPGVTLMGRVRPGVPLIVAVEEANIIGAAIRPPRPATAPATTVPRFEVLVLKDQIVQGLQPALRVFLAAVLFVLLIVCANVANLLLARGTARQREIAVRFALGATRWGVVRQVLAECVVLSIAGGAFGALCAAAGITLVRDLATVEAPGIFRFAFAASLLPRVHEIGINLKMFAAAFGIAALTSLVFGVVPALHLSSVGHFQAMGSRTGGSGPRASRIRAALVVGQLAMATVLLVGAGLLAHSFVKLSTVDNGYDPSNVVTFELVFPADYSIAQKTGAIEGVLSRLRATPAVAAAGFTRAGILIPEEIHVGTFVPHGRTLDEMRVDPTRDEMRVDPTRPRLRPVSHGFLPAAGVRLLGGRELAPTDTAEAPPVIVISRLVAQRYFGGNAVGQFADWYVGKGPAVSMQVVGVVEDVRNESPARDAFPDIFVDYRQLLALEARWGDTPRQQAETTLGFVSFAVRTRRDGASIIPAIGQIVRAVDSNAGVDALIPMERLVASSVAGPRFSAVVLGVFAGVAGLLAAIGIYGVLAYDVIQRTQEIGIRMALGAQRSAVIALVLRKGAILAGIGIAIGLVGAAAGARLLQSMLFGIDPLDPKTFAAVSILFGLVAIVAAYVPARRATTVDPMVALRTE